MIKTKTFEKTLTLEIRYLEDEDLWSVEDSATHDNIVFETRKDAEEALNDTNTKLQAEELIWGI